MSSFPSFLDSVIMPTLPVLVILTISSSMVCTPWPRSRGGLNLAVQPQLRWCSPLPVTHMPPSLIVALLGSTCANLRVLMGRHA